MRKIKNGRPTKGKEQDEKIAEYERRQRFKEDRKGDKVQEQD